MVKTGGEREIHQLIEEETAKMIQLIPHEGISERIVEQTVDVLVPSATRMCIASNSGTNI